MTEAIPEDREYSSKDLRAAGASNLFVRYYENAPADASARREVERGPFSLEKLNDQPSLGGGFFAALWKGNMPAARRRADQNNRRILDGI